MKTHLPLLALMLALLIAWPAKVQAQATVPFSCDGSFYQIRQVVNTSTSDFYRIRRGTVFSEVKLFTVPTAVLNCLAFNKADGFYYALSRVADGQNARLFRLGQDSYTDLGTISGLPAFYYSAGTIDDQGVYWLQRGTYNQQTPNGSFTGLLQKVQFGRTGATTTFNYAGSLQVRRNGNPFDPIAFGDLAFNPTNGLLYNIGLLNGYYTIDRTSGASTLKGAEGTGAGVGSAFFDAIGNFYGYLNGNTATPNSGGFYLLSSNTAATYSATLINSSTPTVESDGASCAFPEQRVDNVLALTGISNVNTTTFDVSFKVGVDNPGSLDLTNLQLTFFGGTASATTNPFSGASSVTLQTIAATNGLTTVATGQNMLTSRNLLSGSNTLGNAASAEVTFTVRVVYPNAGAVPTAAVQNLFTYASSTSAGPNPGASIVNGAALPPPDLLAADASTNGSLFPVTSNADTPSPTPVQFQPSISGTVFEDINYGGGAGRSRVASQGPAVSGARVELYNAGTNAFVGSTTTAADGTYSFTGLTNGTNYVVRVVNGTVSSTRPGTVAGLLPVQTFVNGDVNRVGGESPQLADGGNNTGALNTFQASNTTQSVTTVALNGAAASVDFGFNFSTIVNTNDTGQGSLRQFLLNSNALGAEDQLSQSGQPAGKETSIFMIPSGAATAGLRAGLPSGLTDLTADGTINNRVAVIRPASALPSITGSNTRLDATTQTTNVGNTNNVTLGTGGTVGTSATALGQLNGPEVQLVGTPGQAGSNYGLTVAANNTTITGLAVYGFGNTVANTAGGNIYVTTGATSGTLLTGNVLGAAAHSFTDPGATARSTGHGIYLQAGTDITTLFSGTISNNLIGYNSTGGIELIVNANGNGTTTGYFLEGNEIRGNALGNSSSDGIRLGVNGGVVRNNLLAANQGPGVDLAGSAGNALITNNTVSSNGLNGGGQTAGVRLLGANNALSQNVISNNYGAGIMAQNATATSVFTKNSIFGNGTVLTAAGGAASGQLGIDLLNPTDNSNQGSGDYVSLNANGKTAASGANGLLNFPVLTQAVTTAADGNLQITGFAPAGSVLEFFLSDKTTDGFGQGKTYLFSTTEGASMAATVNGTNAAIADTDTRSGSYSGTINGVNQGAETGATRFAYLIPLSSLTATQRTALTTGGARLTATATTAGTTTSEFSGNILITQNRLLPVELKAFEVAASNANALLSWSTASEQNNAYFVVERSFDGGRFERIGQVQGRGTTSQTTNYNFTDVNVGTKRAGVVYYRLQQVDTDGTASYSPVRTVGFAASLQAGVAAVGVYPNPAPDQQQVRLDLTALPAGSYKVTLTDMAGRVVQTVAGNGGLEQALEVASLPQGSYLVQVVGQAQVYTTRFVKK